MVHKLKSWTAARDCPAVLDTAEISKSRRFIADLKESGLVKRRV